MDITYRCFSPWGAEVYVIRVPKFASLGCRSLCHFAVLEGQLRYRIHEPYHCEVFLDKNTNGIVLPEVEHEVEPLNNAEFYVEFWHRSEKADD